MNIKSNFRIYWPFLVFIVLSFAPFFWLHGSQIIYGPDSIWTVNGSSPLTSTFSTWQKQTGFGYGWSNSGSILYSLSLTVFRIVGFSYPTTQKLMVGALIFTASASVYLLFQEIIGVNNTKSRLIGLLAALIFLLNPLAMTWIWWRFLGVIYVYPCWPILFLAIVRLIKNKATFTELILFGFVISFFAPGISAIILLLTLGLGALIFMTLAIYLNKTESNKRTTLKKLTILIGILLGLNSYWFFPGVIMISHSVSDALTAYDPNAAFWYISQFSGLLNTLRLWGIDAIHISFNGQSYYGNGVSKVMSSSLYGVIMFTPIIAITLLLLRFNRLKKSVRAYAITLIILALIYIFFMKAGASPVSFINQFILQLPFGAGFRIPYDKFSYGVALAFSLLVPLYLYTLRRKSSQIIAGCLLFLLIIAVPLGIFFSNSFLSMDKGTLKGVVAQPPKVYSQLSNLGLKSTDKVLVLPPTNGGESSYNWPTGVQTNSHDIISSYISAGVVFLPNGNGYSDNMTNYLTRNLFSGLYLPNTIEKVLLSTGIDYIFVHKDWNVGFMLGKVPTPQYYEQTLNLMSGLRVVDNNSYYVLYRLPNAPKRRSLLFASSSTINNSSQLDSFGKAVSLYGINVMTTNNSNAAEQIISLGSPTISQNKISYSFVNKNRYMKLYVNKTILRNLSTGATFYIDNKVIKLEPDTSNSSYESASLVLPSGNHIMDIKNLRQSAIPIVQDPEFKTVAKDIKKDWQCGSQFSADTKQAYANAASPGFMQLSSNGSETACHMITLNDLTGNRSLEFSIKYRTGSTNNGRVIVLGDNNSLSKYKTETVLNDSLPGSKSWHTVTFNFLTEPGEHYRLFLYSGDQEGQKSVTDYASLYAMSVPEGINENELVSAKSSNSSSSFARLRSHPITPLLTVKPSSTTIFTRVDLPEDSVLGLNESYDSSWSAYLFRSSYKPSWFDKIFGPTGGVKIPSKDHIVINGYANGWILTSAVKSSEQRNKQYILALEYWPQKFQVIGLTITVTSVGVSLLTLLFIIGRNRHRHYIYKSNKRAGHEDS